MRKFINLYSIVPKYFTLWNTFCIPFTFFEPQRSKELTYGSQYTAQVGIPCWDVATGITFCGSRGSSDVNNQLMDENAFDTLVGNSSLVEQKFSDPEPINLYLNWSGPK